MYRVSGKAVCGSTVERRFCGDSTLGPVGLHPSTASRGQKRGATLSSPAN